MTTIDLASVESRTLFMHISLQMGCDEKQVYHMKPLSHDSASPSLVTKGTIDLIHPGKPHLIEHAVPVIAKISSVAGTQMADSGLLYETNMYRETNRLIKRYTTPHVIVAYGILRCRDLLTLISYEFGKVLQIPGVKDEYLKYVKKPEDDLWNSKIGPHLPTNGIDYRAWVDFAIRSKYWGSKRSYPRKNQAAAVIYFEVASGTTLNKFLKHHMTSSDQLLTVLQQIVYTILCFVDIGLVHNDMHSNNVFVDKLPTPTQFVYFIDNDKFIVLTIEWFARVFDFDRAVMPYKYGSNRIVSMWKDVCYYEGVCDKLNPKFDLFTIIGMLLLGKNYTKDIRKIVDTVYSMAIPSLIDPLHMPFGARFCHHVGIPRGKTKEGLEEYRAEYKKNYTEKWLARKHIEYDNQLKIVRRFQEIINFPYRSRLEVRLAKAGLDDASKKLQKFGDEIKTGPSYIPVEFNERCEYGYIPTDDEVVHPLNFLIQLAKMAGTYHELSSVAPDVLAIVKEAVSARRVFTRKFVDRKLVIRTVMSM